MLLILIFKNVYESIFQYSLHGEFLKVIKENNAEIYFALYNILKIYEIK